MKDTPNMRLHLLTFNRALDETIRLLFEQGPFEKMTIEEFLNTKRGPLSKRYREAAEAVFRDGLDLRKDARITPFIKNEKYFEEGKNPRLVYSRSPKFALLWATFILPIEHALTKLPQVAKGKNFLARGQSFGELIYCPGHAMVENDFSAFESSQRVQVFDLIQKRILNEFFPMYFSQWAPLYEQHLHKEGWTLRGLWYYVFGLMASGDIDTGVFNTIFNFVACRYFELQNGFGNFNFMCDGDDGVLRCPQGAECINSFADFGFNAKLIYRHDYHDVDFCSSKFIQIRPGVFYQIQNLKKMLSSLPYMINKNFDHCLSDYYGSLGYMYSVLYKGIPVYQDLAAFLMTSSSNYVSMRILETVHYGASSAFKEHQVFEVDPNLAFVEVSMAFGYTMYELEQLVLWFSRSKLVFRPEHSVPYKARTRQCHFSVPLEHLEAITVSGKPRRRPKWYGQV